MKSGGMQGGVKVVSKISDGKGSEALSKYGNHNDRSLDENRRELLDAVRYSYQHGKKVIIPSWKESG
jgi:hypothetical protein